ncbi:MAG: glycosyltransferase family 2 protein [Bacteroidota bacterium]|nr:glycosyltransferase family 2 protein [Bacteroidota bacterium]MDP3144351.1 glycosyltransferase family 2 protein [Bacteroidota bacterium]
MEGLVRKISVITINLNNSIGLNQTIKSVLNQSYPHFEYIIIDGNSSDGSKALLANLNDNRAIVISENDAGIYNAMNKGIKIAFGEYIVFINSGDVFNDNFVFKEFINNCNDKDIIYGDLIVKDKLKTHYLKYPENLTFNQLYTKSIPHSGGSFIKKELFIKNGEYDEKYKIVSDWKFFIQALVVNGATYKHISKPFAIFDLEGISTKNNTKMQVERNEVLNELIPDLILKDYQIFNSKPRDYNAESVFNNTNKFYFTRIMLKLLNRLSLILAKIIQK